MQSWPQADQISWTFQADFDKMLCKAMDKHSTSPGFALLLGSILQYPLANSEPPSFSYPRGPLLAFLYMVRQQRKGHFLDDIWFSGLLQQTLDDGGFLTYLSELLENPE